MRSQGQELFGAVGYPVEMVEFLGVARVGIVGAFVLVLDVGAGGLHSFASFSGGVTCAAVDGAAGGFGKAGGGKARGRATTAKAEISSRRGIFLAKEFFPLNVDSVCDKMRQ